MPVCVREFMIDYLIEITCIYVCALICFYHVKFMCLFVMSIIVKQYKLCCSVRGMHLSKCSINYYFIFL